MHDRDSRRTLQIAIALGLITLALFRPVVGFEFTNYDDPDYVVNNPAVNGGVTPQGVAWAFKSGYEGHWHPLTWISHMVDCQVFGLKAGGHHAVNLLFHAANTVLLFLVLAKMTGGLWRSALVAALFGWHPLHVEPVAWVASRKDVLSTFFWLLTMGAYWRYVQNPNRERFILALAFFALGLMSKAMLVTLPFVLLLMDFWPLRRWAGLAAGGGGAGASAPQPLPWSHLVVEKIPFFGLTILSSLAAYWAEKSIGLVVATNTLPLGVRIANALVSYVRYFGKAFWPRHLAGLYPYPDGWTAWQVGGSALFLLAVSALVFWQCKRRPWLFVGWFWFVGTLVPVIGVVLTGIQGMADRYSYVPLIGLSILVAWGVPDLLKTMPSRNTLLAPAAIAVLAVCVALSWIQVQYWRNSVTLFTHVTAVTSNNIRAEYNLAEGLARQGKTAEAIAHYQNTFGMHPNPLEAHYNSQANAHYNLGIIYAQSNQWVEATIQLQEAIRVQPEFASAYNNLGSVLLNRGKVDDAIAQFRAAVKLRPADDSMLRNLTLALMEAGKFAESVTNYNELLQRAPGDPVLHKALGVALAGIGNVDAAVEQFKQAVQLNPNYAEAYLYWGDLYASQGRIAEAKDILAAAQTIQPGLKAALIETAKSRAEQGRTNAAALYNKLAQRLGPVASPGK